jgi:transposase
MIRYEEFCRIRQGYDQEHLSVAQLAAELGLNVKTVAHWVARKEYQPRQRVARPSKLDAFKGAILRLLAQHAYSARQVLQRLREENYTGGYSILKEYIRQVRPPTRPAFLTLHFDPGECAQLDWGCAGSLCVGNTRRRLSFLVMVLCYSRQLYVEFALAETLEHFLAAQQNAFVYFGGAPRKVMVDNLKSAVLSHPAGQPAIFNARYLDFAAFHGFAIKACNVRKANEKGRVENAVGYVKKSFLNGLDLTSLEAVNTAARRWLDEVANVRIHGQTRQKPVELWILEKPKRLPLAPGVYDVGLVRSVHATNRCRVVFDTNRYSVPHEYASCRLSLRAYPDRVVLYHQEKLIAEHLRGYDCYQNLENPDPVRELLQQKRQARDQQLLQRFLRLSADAEAYYRQLEKRRMNPREHVRKIVALSEIYGVDAVTRSLADAAVFEAYSAEYIANLLEQRRRVLPEPGALHLTRRADLLDLDLPQADLSPYDLPTQEVPHETSG